MSSESEPRLTPVSYIVLGLLAWRGESTPYELKQTAAASVGNLWSVQHAQLYSEPERLAALGLVSERRERSGRRRRHYKVTPAGRRALQRWLAEPAEQTYELRDPGLLKIFFGADPGAIAPAQLALHERKLAEYEVAHGALTDPAAAGARLTLEAGIGHEREFVRFWTRLLG